MRNRTTKLQVWLKTQRKYRKVQKLLNSLNHDNSPFEAVRRFEGKGMSVTQHNANRLTRKLEILKKRLFDYNRKWKLGIATSVLLGWMGVMPASAQEGFPAEFDLSTLDGTNGFVVEGMGGQFGELGFTVGSAGDMNGDNIEDFILGVHLADPNDIFNSGEAYVIFGRNSFSSSLDLTELNGANGFKVNGEDVSGFLGQYVSGLGDINGDGLDDIIIAANDENVTLSGNEGRCYIMFGSQSPFSATINSSDINGQNGFVVEGLNPVDIFGTSVSGGDFNGDGLKDILIGAPGVDENESLTDDTGNVYVIFGSTTDFGDSFDLTTLDGTNGFVIIGSEPGGQAGRTSTVAGDFNGDGLDDVLIGSPFVGLLDGIYSGKAHLLFGSSTSNSIIDLSTVDGSNGLEINGINGTFSFAQSLSTLRDFNNDGFDDLIIGSESANGNGEAYILFGSNSSQNPIDPSSLNGNNGFLIKGINSLDDFGASVSSAGDVNGDGFHDLIIGAPGVGNDNGEAYVIFGQPNMSSSFELEDINGNNGFRITGPETDALLGTSVSSAGDINGDGLDDLIVGSPVDNSDGRAYIIFGRRFEVDVNTPPTLITEIPDQRIRQNDFYSIDLSEFFSDPDDDPLSYEVEIDSDIIIFSYGGSEVFFSSFDQAGSTNVTVTASDGNGGEVSDEFVIAINTSPQVVNSIPNQWITSTSGEVTVDLSGVFIDADGDDLSFEATSNNENIVTVQVNLEENTLTSSAVGVGTTSIRVTANDGLSSVEDVFLTSVTEDGNSLFPPVVSLETLDGGDGLTIPGKMEGDRLGAAVNDAGDINGDGISDFIVASRNFTDNRVYIVFGDDNFPASFDLDVIDGSNGFYLDGISALDVYNSAIDALGDVNGDGLDDILIGSRTYGSNGAAFMVFGKTSGFSTAVDLTQLDGSNGVRIETSETDSGFGRAVSKAGDINGDGLNDLVIGAYFANNESGETYVIFGKNSWDPTFQVSALDGQNGLVINGENNYDQSGLALGGGGDVNGDGIDDIIIGAWGTDRAYVVFGSENSFSSELVLSSLDGSNGFILDGSEQYTQFARHIAAIIDDVNGDGLDDIMISDQEIGPNYYSEIYVLFGNAGGFSSNISVTSLNGSNGFTIRNLGDDELGEHGSSAGDINGDNIADVIFSSNENTYVIFGNSSFQATLNLELINGSNGFTVPNTLDDNYSSASVDGLGDINNDGIDDLIIGDQFVDPDSNIDAGAAYIIYGISSGPANNPPVVANPIPDQIYLLSDGAPTIDLTNVFIDADNDELTYELSTSDVNVFTLGEFNGSLSVYIHGLGTATASITANDGNGGTAIDEFLITIETASSNTAPIVVNPILDQAVELLVPVTINIQDVFSDPDGDFLVFESISSNTDVATALIDNSTLTILLTGLQEGTAVITVTAEDEDFLEVTDEFLVTVISDPVLSIGESLNTEIDIYPNPADQAVTVLSDAFLQYDALFTLYDLSGYQHLVPKERTHSGGYVLDLVGLPIGMYLLEIKTERSNIIMKIMKQ